MARKNISKVKVTRKGKEGTGFWGDTWTKVPIWLPITARRCGRLRRIIGTCALPCMHAAVSCRVVACAVGHLVHCCCLLCREGC